VGDQRGDHFRLGSTHFLKVEYFSIQRPWALSWKGLTLLSVTILVNPHRPIPWHKPSALTLESISGSKEWKSTSEGGSAVALIALIPLGTCPFWSWGRWRRRGRAYNYRFDGPFALYSWARTATTGVLRHSQRSSSRIIPPIRHFRILENHWVMFIAVREITGFGWAHEKLVEDRIKRKQRPIWLEVFAWDTRVLYDNTEVS
jgi:hypothetical protein